MIDAVLGYVDQFREEQSLSSRCSLHLRYLDGFNAHRRMEREAAWSQIERESWRISRCSNNSRPASKLWTWRPESNSSSLEVFSDSDECFPEHLCKSLGKDRLRVEKSFYTVTTVPRKINSCKARQKSANNKVPVTSPMISRLPSVDNFQTLSRCATAFEMKLNDNKPSRQKRTSFSSNPYADSVMRKLNPCEFEPFPLEDVTVPASPALKDHFLELVFPSLHKSEKISTFQTRKDSLSNIEWQLRKFRNEALRERTRTHLTDIVKQIAKPACSTISLNSELSIFK
ncbi:hypothetical protein Ciccas_012881 [Cichlidogyrus casuarinus]|uniref:Uncharacterized protein n=1 Tax=Cichlidogyrus casuarinus TaxID=1844966 RepID=A0ABD2PS55_9PLAT